MRQIKGLLFLLAFLPFLSLAQSIRKGDCTPPSADETAEVRGVSRSARLPAINRSWDPNKIYKQLVVLVEFKGDSTYFSMEQPREFYDSLFNYRGFNKRLGNGCVADYFRDQSRGLFNLGCDVFGPYQLTTKAQPYDNPSVGTRNYAREQMIDATRMLLAENANWDYSQYDWDGDGEIEQMIFVFAGMSGNQGTSSYGYIWPNTSSFSAITMPGNVVIRNYSVSAEKWGGTTLCGIGTICHEYAHCLGLPDIYPTGGSSGFFSIVDEWDLMDGGNFTNYGWCPPNYTAMEKMLMGWLTPTELYQPTEVRNMKPLADGGEAYIIKHTDSEYLLLENRQWDGWDAGLPGKGLVVYHVDYLASAWSGNFVNNMKGHFRFDLVHADNMDYNQWETIVPYDNNQWAGPDRMHNKHLSTSSYPWSTDSTNFVNNQLTDTSIPATVMYNRNAADTTILSKSITNITMSDEGNISFCFMGGDPTGIRNLIPEQSIGDGTIYDMQGRRYKSQFPLKRGLYIINRKKIII